MPPVQDKSKPRGGSWHRLLACVHPEQPGHRPKACATDLAALAVAVALLAGLCALSGMPTPWPFDHFSDMHVLMAGENFATYGFARLHFLPVLHLGGIGPEPQYYLHYPPLPYVINGLWQAAGVRSLPVLRCISSTLYVAGLYCLYAALAPLIGRLAALCGLAFLATCRYSYLFGQSLHAHPYNFLFLGLFLLLFLRVLEEDGRGRRWKWAGCWAVLFLGSLTTFEFIMYCQVFAWAYALLARRARGNLAGLLLLATAPLAGVGLHFAQNVWAIGWEAAWADRLGFQHIATQGARLGIASLLPLLYSRTVDFLFLPLPVLPLVGAAALALAYRVRPAGVQVEKAAAAFWALTLAGSTWYLAMPGHVHPHPHTVNQLVPLSFAAVGGGIGVVVWGAYAVRSWMLRAAVLMALLVLGEGQYRYLRQALEQNRTLPDSVTAEALSVEALPADTAIAHNSVAEAQVAYYLRRPTWRSPREGYSRFPESLESLTKACPPSYKLGHYLFFAPAYDESVETLKFLAANCPGRLAHVPFSRKPERYVILFDISELHRPPQLRRPLDPSLRDEQLQGTFEQWTIPNFPQRILKAYEGQVGQPMRIEK